VLETRADFGKGSPANPMSDAELAEKFRECARRAGIDRARMEEILALAWKLETLSDITQLTRLLGA